MKLNAQNQRDWADQQRRENMAAAEAQREEEKAWAHQEDTILRMRGMLEDEQNQRKADYAKQIQMENKRMAQEKRDREAAWRNDQESTNQAETTLTNHNEVLNMDGTILRTDNHRWTIWRLLRRKVVELTTRNPQQAFLSPYIMLSQVQLSCKQIQTSKSARTNNYWSYKCFH